MQEFEYSIDRAVFAVHPGYCRGVIVVRDAENSGAPRLQALLRAEEDRVRERLHGFNIAGHPAIAAWRDAYRRFGAKPSEHRASIEAMARRVIKPDALPTINPLVDIGNIVSLRHMLPAGVHPLPQAGGRIELRSTKPGDRFLPTIGGATETPTDGEIVLCQGEQVLTRRWTWRQAAGTQTLPETTSVFFNFDGLPPISTDQVRAAMRDVEQLVGEHTGGRIILSTVLSARKPALAFHVI